MNFAIAAALTALLAAAPLAAQDGTASPATGTPAPGATATQPGRDSGGPAVGVTTPKIDPKLLIDVFKRLTRPRAPKPPVAAPLPTQPTAGAVPTPKPVAPIIVTPAAPAPAPPTPSVAAPVSVPHAVKPRRVASARPPPPVAPMPASPVTAIVAAPPRPPIATPIPPDVPALQPPVATSQSPRTPASAEPPSYFMASTPLPLIGLLAVAAAIAAILSFSRARRIARTRAALALSPRLDLSMGGFSLGGLALAGPTVAIRARLDQPEAPNG